MSIRSRLLVSYTLMLIVTILIFLTVAFFITVAVTGDTQSVKQFYTIHLSLDPLTTEQDNVFQELKYIAKEHPEQLAEPDVLSQYDQRLRKLKGALFVRQEDRILVNAPTLGLPKLGVHLPPYDLDNLNIRDTMNIGDRFFAYSKYDYLLSGQRSSLYVIREVSPFTAIVSQLLPLLVSLLFVLLVLANVLLYLYVTRSMIKPLHLLTESAERIKQGDLDFHIRNDAGGEIARLGAAFEEMRQKLRESEQLQVQYERNRKELLTNISHDLKTPITTIKGYIEGIRDGVPETQEMMDKYVTTIYNKSVDMQKMIDELFLYSKLDLNQLPFHLQQMDIGGFLEELIEELRFDYEASGVTIEWVNLTAHSIQVRMDPEKLKRAIANVMENSVKYMDKPDKRARVTLSAEPHCVWIRVQDNGRGIRADALPHIFERFYRAEGSRNTKTGGSGLGLAIAKQMLEGHGGTISAESELGQGTIMKLVLPRMEEYTGEKNSNHRR
ncbi:ATP-binding protein [Paenibacillus sp. GCM10023252]|uniref:sensor histidine kinase n=1 Tax=Paenibacillus sp. GCM10023252 TaxID=3252649 RepID=UPI0036218FCB